MEIVNFQAHKDLKIEFGKTITSIVGPSDRGKSSILRALIWCLTNRPGGDSFIRYGANGCSVSLFIGDNKIERVKSQKQNSYFLNNKEFKAIRTDIPSEISKILNVDENNIQQQHDPVFWFSNTAGDVGKKLNQIVNLDIIDFTLGEIQSQQKEARTELQVIASLLEEQQGILKDSEKIENLSITVGKVDLLEADLKKNEGLQVKLGDAIGELTELDRKSIAGKVWEEAQKQLGTLCAKYLTTCSNQEKLQKNISSIQEFEKQLKFEIPDILFTVIEKAEKMDMEIKEKRKVYKKLSCLLEELEDLETRLSNEEIAAEKAERELHQILENNVCPLCGKGIKK